MGRKLLLIPGFIMALICLGLAGWFGFYSFIFLSLGSEVFVAAYSIYLIFFAVVILGLLGFIFNLICTIKSRYDEKIKKSFWVFIVNIIINIATLVFLFYYSGISLPSTDAIVVLMFGVLHFILMVLFTVGLAKFKKQLKTNSIIDESKDETNNFDTTSSVENSDNLNNE